MSKVKLPKNVEETRTIPFVFSDQSRDSYGTVFTAKDWDLDRFNKNGIAFYNHESWSDDPDMAIGHARAWVEGKQLLGEITFETAELNPTADKVFRKYLNGTFKGVSIRFLPLEAGKWGEGDESREGSKPTYYIGRRELVEISAVPIPSNKNALTRAFSDEQQDIPELAEGEGYYVHGSIRLIEAPEDTEELITEQNSGINYNHETVCRLAANAVRAMANV